MPATAHAVIANRSAVGEQYVDLQPTSTTGPYLKDGSVIPKDRTSIPAPIENILNSAIKFTEEVPLGDFHTVITELGKALSGQSENLEKLTSTARRAGQGGGEIAPRDDR